MRPPKALCGLVLITMAPQLTGCYNAMSVSPQSLWRYPATADQSRVLKVRRRNQSPVELTGVWRDSVIVHGTRRIAGRSVLFEIPLGEVEKIEELRFSGEKTTLLLLGIVVAIAGAVAYIYSTIDYGPIFSQ